MLKSLLDENHSKNPRQPASRYSGRNGFKEPPSNPEPLLFANSFNSNTAVLRVSDQALHRHRQAMFILTQKDRPIPSLTQMKDELNKSEESANVEIRIKEVKGQHLEDLQRLYAAHAAEYHEEMMDRYRSKDETQYPARGENNTTVIASYDELERLYRDTRDAACYEMYWHDDIARMNYAYQKQLIGLRIRRQELRHKEEEERKRLDAMFPMNQAEWKNKTRDVQLRVARFLTCTASQQEKMMNEFQWAWRQVQPLRKEFNEDAGFRAEVQAIMLANDVKDPRTKR
ncbi:hypothetical protein AMATHDRAFT_1297 [Amanita thiersii Skay4041]|uniref:Uncharacterized protein n=1 Tax=Amanita thiersii Skay4041 TaxID=703135 RepID=A0A2A9NXQ9_9AGAR|nr:hypothetical protein AMATHDRAFT_1297 [Amanita thiersii Skay4041]